MPSFDPISTGIGAALGIAQTATGIVNNAKAKKEAAILKRTRPTYSMSTQTGKELDLAESELASGGMSARAERAYGNLQNQQFSSSLNAILKGGGSVNNIADTFGASEEGRQRLSLLNDELRLKQIENLTRARRYYGEQEDKQFMYNVDAPWKDAAQANAAARTQAQQDIWGGLKTVAGVGMQAAASKYNWDRYDASLKLMNPTAPADTSGQIFYTPTVPAKVDQGAIRGGYPKFIPSTRRMPIMSEIDTDPLQDYRNYQQESGILYQ